MPGFDGGEYFHGFEGLSAFVLAVAIVAAVAWVVAFAIRWLWSNPRLPDAGPSTDELGPEPPAVANLLVNRWKVTHAAVQATLLDLAARRALGIDMLSREEFVVRVREAPAEPLTIYERQVYDLVKDRATGGSAPVEALHLGEGEQAKRWGKRFRDAVVSDARSRGLVRNRWSRGDLVILGGALLVVLELFALSFGIAHLFENSGSGDDDFDRWDWLWIAPVAWVVLMAAASQMKAIRDTALGREVCARWLGVRQYLRDREAFETAPPASVVVWERFLSYAAALGVAHEAVERLPLEPDDPDTAWSRRTGMWRLLRVEYPERFGFGRKPLNVFFEGLGLTLLWGFIGFFAIPLVANFAWEVANDALDNTEQADKGVFWLVVGFGGFFGIAGIYVLANLIRGVARLVRGGLDLGQPVVEEGTVVKLHGNRCAIDDGVGDEVIAWTPPANAPGLRRGMDIRITRSKRLYWVTKLEVLDTAKAERPDEDAVAADPRGRVTGIFAEPAAVPLGLTAAFVSQLAGRPMAEVSPSAAFGHDDSHAAEALRHASVQVFRDAQGGQLTAGMAQLPEFATKLINRFAGRAAAADAHASQWHNGRTLTQRTGNGFLTVDVALEGMTEDARRALAQAVAEAAEGAAADEAQAAHAT